VAAAAAWHCLMKLAAQGLLQGCNDTTTTSKLVVVMMSYSTLFARRR